MHERNRGGCLGLVMGLWGEWRFRRQTDDLIRAQNGKIPPSALSQDYVDPAPASARDPNPYQPGESCPLNPYADK